MEIVVASTKKEEIVHIKQVWIGWNCMKAATCYSEKSFFENRPQQQHLSSSSYQRNQPMVKLEFFINACLPFEFNS